MATHKESAPRRNSIPVLFPQILHNSFSYLNFFTLPFSLQSNHWWGVRERENRIDRCKIVKERTNIERRSALWSEVRLYIKKFDLLHTLNHLNSFCVRYQAKGKTQESSILIFTIILPNTKFHGTVGGMCVCHSLTKYRGKRCTTYKS